MMWSDAGKPSAIVAGIVEIDTKSTSDNLKFMSNKVMPMFVFNQNEEPRGLAVSGKTLFYAAIYRFVSMAGRLCW